MKTLLPERPIVEGYYLCIELDGQTVYVSPTLFTTEKRADDWRKRYQANFPGRTVYLKPKEVEMKR